MCRGAFLFRLRDATGLCRSNLLAAVHARNLIHVVRKAEVAGLFISNYLGSLKRVVRPAIAGVTSGVAHSD